VEFARLARSLRQLGGPLEGLGERQAGFRSLTESLDADTADSVPIQQGLAGNN